MSSKAKGTKYEKYIEKICKSINSYRCFNLIELTQNKKIVGDSGVEHQIDVYWEFVFNSKRYKCIFECKNYENKISKDKIATLDSISHDIQNSIPIIVSTKGFQSGAQAYAKARGVTPFICRELYDEDWHNRVKTFEIHLIVNNPIINISVISHDENCDNMRLTNIMMAVIHDYDKGIETSVCDFAKAIIKPDGIDTQKTIHFNNAFLFYEPEDIKVKVSDLLISIKYDKSEEVITIDGDDYIQGLLFDVLNNQRAIIYNNGRIKMID